MRLTHCEALTCDQNHSYGPEQKADDNGAMDKFEQNTAHDTCTGQPILFGAPGLVMDYYDGNTVTGLWNYAQNYSMSDNYYDTAYGPSTPGALNLISGRHRRRLRGRADHDQPDPGAGRQRPGQRGLGKPDHPPGHGLRRHRPVLRPVLRRQPHLHQPARRHDRQEHR